MRARRWCFTLNNYSVEDASSWEHELRSDVSYSVVGLEVGDSGTRHLQGFVCFTKAVRLNGVRKIHSKAHWEVARGSVASNRKYCTKDGSFHELGTKPEPGRRTDLEEIREKCEAGTPIVEIAAEHFTSWARNYRAIDKYISLMRENQELRTVQVSLYVGATGTGKTWAAFAEAPDAFILQQGAGATVWWDGYIGQSTVIIDDFEGWIPWSMLLRLLDRYPLRVEVKGGSQQALWTRVIITSNMQLEEWYPDHQGRLGPLERRVAEVREFKERYDGDSV